MRSLGKKPHFWPSLREKTPFLRLKKVLLTGKKRHFCKAKKGVVGCARLRTGAIRKKSLLCRKALIIMQILIITLGAIRFLAFQKSLLCRKARYVRSLGKKPHFWPSQRLKKVLLTEQGCARLQFCTGLIILYRRKSLELAPKSRKKLGALRLSEKKVYCVEKRDMCDP